MPVYDLMAIVRAAAPRTAVAEVLRRAAVAVLDAGGVVTDVKSFGTRNLAYSIRRAGELHKEVRPRQAAARAARLHPLPEPSAGPAAPPRARARRRDAAPR
jgi:ribosomal protein S6